MTFAGPVGDFFRLMGAVLAANLLTVAFVYSIVVYTSLEKRRRQDTPAGGALIAMMLVVFVCLFGGLFASGFFDKWLT